MTVALLWTLLACSGCSPEPAEPVAEPIDPALIEPEQMADLAVPSHGDLELGSLTVEVKDPTTYYPEVHAGDWAAYRVWSSRVDRDWLPAGPQIRHFPFVDDKGAQRDLIRPEGEAMRVSSSWLMKRVGSHYGIASSKATGQEAMVPLKTPEVMIANPRAAYTSSWTSVPVTVELVGTQQVTVPAGSFDALRVRRSWARGKRSTTEERWWTKERGEVASVVRVADGERTEARLTVLSQFGNVVEAQALRQVWDDIQAELGME